MTLMKGRIKRIQRLHKRLALGRPDESVGLNLVHTTILGKRVTFCVNMQRDPIQRNHRRGSFYEMFELQRLRRLFPAGGTFIDIGANVGNHTLFAAMFMGAGRVIPIEPNPLAFELLIQNVLVNRLEDIVDLTQIGIGLSDVSSGGFAMTERQVNLGKAQMEADGGDLEVLRGDEVFADERPDFIKIDVEGMEMQVLSGLEGLLQRANPVMMIEVDNDLEAKFLDWVASNDYGVFATHARYTENKNHLICPKAQVAKLKTIYEADDEDADEPETESVGRA